MHPKASVEERESRLHCFIFLHPITDLFLYVHFWLKVGKDLAAILELWLQQDDTV